MDHKQPNNHLLFMKDLKLYNSNNDQLDCLINIVSICPHDRMSFGLDNGEVLEMKKGTIVDSKRKETIKGVDSDV